MYLALSTIISRNNYIFLKEMNTEIMETRPLTMTEPGDKLKIRKKILQDITYHGLDKNWNKKLITKLSINQEGKIIGYKVYQSFYPNYFTKLQIKTMFKTQIISIKKNLHLDIIRLSTNNL